MTLHEYAARARESYDTLRDWFEARRAGIEVREARAARRQRESYRIEAQTFVTAAQEDSERGDVQVARQRAAFNDQIERLRLIPKRTSDQELMLVDLERRMREVDTIYGLRRGVVPDVRLAELGPVGAPRGFLGSLAGGSVMQWVAAGGAAIGLVGLTTAAVQGARLNHVKAENERLELAMASAERVIADRTAERDILADNVRQAAEGAQQAAQTIEAERARANAARRRERDLINEIQSRTRDVGAPPAWSLRDSEGGDPAGPGAGASGDPG